jgi:arylsulfatase A-like enzyme
MARSPSALATLVLPLALLAAACGAEAPAPRNLLIVCVDTLRADELGAYGAEPSITPALDRLAAESVVFERARAAASWTLPSVGALFTSLYPSSTGLWTFESRLSDSVTTLAERFRAAGYLTHGIASHVFFDGKYGLQQGFASFDDELCHRKGEPGWKPVTSPEVSSRAVRWLAERRPDGEPWLLFVHFFDPHKDYLDHEAADLGDAQRPERERYRSEIAFTDRHVGALLDALERGGQAADTHVLFFSDHGEAFEEHAGVRYHSYSLYDEELRVPLFLRVPGVAPRRVAEFVRSIDLLPTLLALHGLPAPEMAEGASLVPLLGGGAHESPALLAEIRLKDGHHANALLRGRYKLVEDVSNGRFLLFDLVADPGEQRDLAAAEPALVAELTAELRARVRAAEEKATLFGSGGTVQHTPEELQHIKDLGYSGEEPEPEAEPGSKPR